MSARKEKIAETLMKHASKYVMAEGNKTSLITFTHCDVLNDLSKAVVLFTVLPDDKQIEAMEFLKRREIDFKEYLKRSKALIRVPYIEFAIDKGEKNRQNIDALLANS